MTVRLVCPLCRATVFEGRSGGPGACPGCGAAFAGDAATPQEAAATAVREWGLADDPVELADRLFRTDPGQDGVDEAIASDEREGFYHWWVFSRAGQ